METSLRTLTIALLSSGNVLLREAGRLFKPHGITAAQYNVLTLLARASDGLRPSELTAALVVDASSTTYLLDCMATAGWLRRTAVRSDRRASCILLTPAGQRLYAKVAPIYAEALRQTMQGLNGARVASLIAALAEIQQAAPAVVDRLLAVPPAPQSARLIRP